MTTTPARPDLAYVNATRLDPAQLVTELRDLLSAKLVAYLGGVKETRAVRQWADGTRQVAGGQDLRRLRLAYQAATLLAERDHPAVIQAWFQGLNPALGRQVPRPAAPRRRHRRRRTPGAGRGPAVRRRRLTLSLWFPSSPLAAVTWPVTTQPVASSGGSGTPRNRGRVAGIRWSRSLCPIRLSGNRPTGRCSHDRR